MGAPISIRIVLPLGTRGKGLARFSKRLIAKSVGLNNASPISILRLEVYTWEINGDKDIERLEFGFRSDLAKLSRTV
jgi:hypothetical protein